MQPLGPLGLEQVVEGVVERPQVGVDLGHQVAGEEAQALAGLDRRPGQDDPVDLAGLQGLHGQGHGQIGLAGAGRADPEGDDVGGDGVGVLLLPAGLRTDGPAPGRAQQLGGEDLGGADVVVHHVDGPVHLDGVEALARLEQDDQLLEQGTDPFGPVALDGDLVPPDGDPHIVERPFDQPQQLVTLAEQAGHEVVAGNEDFDLGACHVRSGPDPTSGPGGAIPWSAVAGRPGPTTRSGSPGAQPGGQSKVRPPEHVEVEVVHRVERVGTHVEHQPVATVVAADPLGVGHRPGRHQQGGHVLGVVAGHRRGVDDVALRDHQHVDRAPGG